MNLGLAVVISKRVASACARVRLESFTLTSLSPDRPDAASRSSTQRTSLVATIPSESPGWYLSPDPVRSSSTCLVSLVEWRPTMRIFSSTVAGNGLRLSWTLVVATDDLALAGAVSDGVAKRSSKVELQADAGSS